MIQILTIQITTLEFLITLSYCKVFYLVFLSKWFYNVIYSLLNNKKEALKIFGRRTWCAKKSFGYRVAHHGYLLTSFPGHNLY